MLVPSCQPTFHHPIGVGKTEGHRSGLKGGEHVFAFADTTSEHGVHHAGHRLLAFLFHQRHAFVDGGVVRAAGVEDLVEAGVEDGLGPAIGFPPTESGLQMFEMAQPAQAAVNQLPRQTSRRKLAFGETSVFQSRVENFHRLGS